MSVIRPDVFSYDIALLFSSSVIIFVADVTALVLKRKTPELELFRFVKVPERGSTMDVMERARLMRDVEVYVGGVVGNKDIGHLVLAADVPSSES